MSDLRGITDTLIAGDAENLEKLVKKALENGFSASEILQNALISGMDIVGDKMESGEMFIPEVLMAARAMSISVETLQPLLAEDESATAGKVIIGTVKGDLHDIGKNLVSMMFESTGFEVIDLGVDVDPGKFVSAINDNKPKIVALSALLTTTMPMMAETIKILDQNGLRDHLKIIIGGAPVNQEFADEIGADGYAPDAGSAAKLARSLAA